MTNDNPIRQALATHQLTRRELAHHLRLHPNSVERLANGRAPISTRILTLLQALEAAGALVSVPSVYKTRGRPIQASRALPPRPAP